MKAVPPSCFRSLFASHPSEKGMPGRHRRTGIPFSDALRSLEPAAHDIFEIIEAQVVIVLRLTANSGVKAIL